MPDLHSSTGDLELDRLVAEVRSRQLLLESEEDGSYVASELPAIQRVLSRIRDEGLARGPVFCEWGSGLGGACGVAELNGFRAVGIEIRSDLVAAARSIAQDLGSAAVFAHGTFLRPDDEDLAAGAGPRTQRSFGTDAWEELGLEPDACDVVFAYPWPHEEAFVDALFSRHASPGALLLTFHGFGRILVQRKLADQLDLRTHGWL